MQLATEVGKLGYSRMDRPISSPQVKRRKRQTKRLPIFLPEDLWKQLSKAAKFATRVFELTGQPETVSRNDFIEDSLLWALAAYWKDKGGEPQTAAEIEKCAAAYAKRTKAAEAEASGADEQSDS